MPDGNAAKTAPISTQLAAFARGLRLGDNPETARIRAKHLMLDASALSVLN